MPRPALTDEQRRATRRRIREAAAELHAENGLAGISARAVAEKAGVSVGTLYSHFSNLGELMQSLWRTPARRVATKLEQLAAEVTEPVERLRAMLHIYASFAVEERAVFRGAFLFVRPESHEAPARVSLDDDRFFQALRGALVDGQEAGVFRAGHPNKLTQTVLGAVHGALALPINMHRLALDTSAEPPEHMIEVMLEWLQSPNS